MKILFISDIHGDNKNLSIIDNISCDEIICLGDIGDDYFVNEWLTKHAYKLLCLKGNNDYPDETLFTPNELIKFTVDNITINCTHGHIYSYSKGNLQFNDILIYGHEHLPYIRKENDKIYICVGSLSRPRNGSKESFCIYENGTFTLYDINQNIIDQITIKKSL